MADEEKPDARPATGPSTNPPGGDLKSRLGLTGKSQRALAREEEERRRTEEDARQKLEAEKQKFTEFGAASKPAPEARAPELKAADLRVSEEELQEIQEQIRAAQKGGFAKWIVVGAALVLVSLAGGYLLGGTFSARATENRKTREAQILLDFVRGTIGERKEFFENLVIYRKKIDDLVTTLSKPGLDPKFQLEQLTQFLDYCDGFLAAYQPLTAKEIFQGEVVNSEIIPDVMGYAESVNLLLQTSARMAGERSLLRLVGSSAADSAKPAEPVLATFLLEPKTTPTGMPYSGGQYVQRAADPIPPAAPAPGEPPPATPPVWRVPVLLTGQTDPQVVESTRLAEVDAAPVLQQRDTLYRLALLERVKGTLSDLKQASDQIRWDRVAEKLEKIAQRKPYFVF